MVGSMNANLANNANTKFPEETTFLVKPMKGDEFLPACGWAWVPLSAACRALRRCPNSQLPHGSSNSAGSETPITAHDEQAPDQNILHVLRGS